MTKMAAVVILTVLIPLTAPAQTLKPFSKQSEDNGAFVSDVTIPDGTAMSPGQSFIKTWRIGPRARPVLIKTFRSDPDERLRALALGGLADIMPQTNEVVRLFLGATTDASPYISTGAVMIVQEVLPSQIGPYAVPALVDAMHDANPITRQLAIQLLASLGPAAKEVTPTLRELADHDPELQVREIANEIIKLIEAR